MTAEKKPKWEKRGNSVWVRDGATIARERWAGKFMFLVYLKTDDYWDGNNTATKESLAEAKEWADARIPEGVK